ncbi:MAG: EAL domain-containing response regulator [Loktanella sp.]|nr:EAL domain-containing response regulator [Loktanella sp.]
MSTHTNRKRLLVLDDEKNVAETICMMAGAAEFDTEHTCDAGTFIEKVIAWKPTHVVIDLQLGDRNGIEVIHSLGETGCDAALIIVSGLGGRILEASAIAANERGLNVLGTLAKPFSRKSFQSMLAVEVPSGRRTLNPAKRSIELDVSDQHLVAALKEERLIAHFQPKISCVDGELVGFECLARWPQPNGGMLPPDIFIALAEKTGLIDHVTRSVYTYALANLPDQVRERGLKVALNLSPLNLGDVLFPRWLLNKCGEHGLAPSQIILEITETASMDRPLALLENMTQFRIQGFHLSIDDFGVGYSSLIQLARLPFSEMKVDQMFVKSLATSDESQKIVTSVVGLGKSMGLNVVAEGVEDAWALGFLRDIGCHEAQGYFIARPMDSIAATEWKGCSWFADN